MAELLYPKPIPRDYQIEAADAYLLNDELAALIQLATGLGKTVLSGMIFGRTDGRCLFLAHTDELVRQTCRTMLRLGLWPSVEKADEYHGGPYLPDARERKRLFPGGYPPNDWFIFNKVLVSSMQTFITRLDKYRDIPFAITCIDEAHRSRCRTYEDIVSQLYDANPQMRLLGLTATPYRADKKNLGTLFPAFAYRMPILDAIDRGWLVDVRGVEVKMKADTAKWKVGATSHGRDITDGSLRQSMQSEECIESIAYPIIERGEGRKGIVFLPGVEAAEAVAAALNHLKPGLATFVHGGVPKKERRRRVREFEDGTVRVMTGCNVMVEGFDVPDVSLVVMARPTQSRGLYEQMLGRGLRPLADAIAGRLTAADRKAALAASAKPDCLVMDFANTTRFKLVNALDIVLSDADDAKKREYIARVYQDRDPDDRRAIRDQLGELESLFALAEALRVSGGPPPRQEYQVRDVSLYGAGGTAFSAAVAGAARPSRSLIDLADQFFIDADHAERMSAAELTRAIDDRKRRLVGKRNYGLLKNRFGIDPKEHGLNWHDAEYLRRLAFARPERDLPANWKELVERDRTKRGNTGGQH
jgi:superfamily II DNA or RNA helicase